MTLRASAVSLIGTFTLAAGLLAQASPFLGKWNITGTGPHAGNVYWLEVTQDGDQLNGMFLNRVSSPGRLAVVKVEGAELIFQGFGRGNQPGGPEYRARIDNGRLIVRHTPGRGRGADPAAPPRDPIEWIGVRPPAWPAVDANGSHTYGKPVVLVDGTSLDAWGVQHEGRAMGWRLEDGAITNEKGSNNLVSKEKFTDFRLQAEYKLAEGSNSGIYLRGRYELQLFDDFAREGAPRNTDHAAIYGRTAAAVKASKPPHEWQTLEAIVVANRVTVTLNGQRVHDNAVIEGITGGALDNDELSPGPILIQGDHSRVWVRKLVVTPITTAKN